MLGFSPIAASPLAGEAVKHTVFSVNSGTFTLSMQGAGKLITDVYPSGDFVTDGQAATFSVQRAFVANSRVFILTGTNADTETRTDAANVLLDRNYGIHADAGSFALTYSTDLDFKKGFGIILASGTFAETGQDVTFIRNVLLPLDGGSFLLSGQDASVTAQFNLSVNAGSATHTGHDFTFTVQRYFGANRGAFALTFQDFVIRGFLSPYVPPEAYTGQTVPSEDWIEQTGPTDTWVEQTNASSPTFTEASDVSTNTWTEAA